MAASSDSVKVLILGGIGFIGRNLVKHIVDNNLASFVRVADKVLPSTAFLNAEHQKAFDDARVEYKQSNLTNEGSIKRAYTDPCDGKFAEGETFDFVFNLAAETKFGQTPEVYNEKVLDLSLKVAKAAVAHKAKKFVEVSTGQVYASSSKASKEDDKTKPWTTMATYKLKAEDELKNMKDLPLLIVRPAIVYGPGDTTGISPRIITGAVYKHLGEKMKFLWSKDLKINTVHVRDCAAAMWLIAEKGTVGETYNLADKGDTDQGKINALLETIFGIKTGFQGAAVNAVAKVKLKMVCEISNDKHLKPWSDVCKEAGIVNTPLTPYLDVELLANTPLCLDGSKVEKLGFKYQHPAVTIELLQEVIDGFSSLNLFPKI